MLKRIFKKSVHSSGSRIFRTSLEYGWERKRGYTTLYLNMKPPSGSTYAPPPNLTQQAPRPARVVPATPDHHSPPPSLHKLPTAPRMRALLRGQAHVL